RKAISSRSGGSRHRLATLVLAVSLAHTAGLAHAQTAAKGASGAEAYPERPVRVIVPLPPGGSTDTIVRALALRLTDAFKQTFVVDNRPGAGSLVGLDILASAAP